MHLKLIERDDFYLIVFDIPQEGFPKALFEKMLQKAIAKTSGKKPILLNGCGPNWAVNRVVEASADVSPALAILDADKEGYVVFLTRRPNYYQFGKLISSFPAL
ncbi:MAG: hypothetical protein HYW70_01180 [Candidatus Nealsonbacteria bacterium]|nr:hypothetical protein [Candidatus Nealsonbacteria bacterium]